MSESRFAGVDWASEEHAVCVGGERGRIVEGRGYRDNEQGIRALCARLRVVLVALERPDGLLIERLLDAGLAVIAVYPNHASRAKVSMGVRGHSLIPQRAHAPPSHRATPTNDNQPP